MFKNAIFFSSCVCITITLTGCFSQPEPPKPQYKPTALENNARGITIASSKPYNCKIVGEIERQEDIGDTVGATKNTARQGAINVLKNEAAYVVKEGQKIMITITKEESRCKYTELDKKKNKTVREALCPQNDDLPNNVKIISYKVYGDIFDCGDKYPYYQESFITKNHS